VPLGFVVWEPPTATQTVTELHDTWLNPLDVTPVGLGVDWTDQLEPSQDSASGALLEFPTATQVVAVGQDTPTMRDWGWIASPTKCRSSPRRA